MYMYYARYTVLTSKSETVGIAAADRYIYALSTTMNGVRRHSSSCLGLVVASSVAIHICIL